MLERMNPLPAPGTLRVQTACCRKMVDATAVLVDMDHPFTYLCDLCVAASKAADAGASSTAHEN